AGAGSSGSRIYRRPSYRSGRRPQACPSACKSSARTTRTGPPSTSPGVSTASSAPIECRRSPVSPEESTGTDVDEFGWRAPSNNTELRDGGTAMRVVAYEFMSLDGVVQAPGGADEDRDGGFAHGGWSMPYFDPEVMGPIITNGMNTAEALVFGRRTWQGM